MSVSKSAPPAATLSVHTGDGGLRSFAGSVEGGLPMLEAAAHDPAEDLLGLGTPCPSLLIQQQQYSAHKE
jgi:hypothetical protein